MTQIQRREGTHRGLPAGDSFGTDAVRARFGFTRAEWRRLMPLYAVICLVHVCGWGLYLDYSASSPALVGLGLAAYLLGLRHGFDADHISAVDDTTRYLLQQGKRPLGLGFFFSLGHSTVVFLLSACLIASAAVVRRDLPWLQSFGALIGGGVSAFFLLLIGTLNVLVVLDLLKVWSHARITIHEHEHAHVEELLAQRGLINRLLGARLRRFVVHSWQMYPLGLLFGLGFDTASEVAVLAMTAGAAAGDLPAAAALSLPILFTAGMCAVDTTDGVLMSKAYDWAFINPVRKMLYNIAVTSLSAAMALAIGGLELLQILAGALHVHLLERLQRLDFSALGYGIVGLFALAWGVSLAVWKWGPLAQRHGVARPR